MGKRGRKPGSTNHKYEFVTAVAPACVRCGSDRITKLPGAPALTKAITGTLRDGRRYNSIRWQRSVCECGQHLNVKTYLTKAPPKDNSEPIKPTLQDSQNGTV